tara:strand:- start:1319 stop:4153 length:2835 start_codon:yes stop_codon:yes gene_type:complete
METKIFLEKALADDGLYCIFATNTRTDRRVQKFFTSVDALLDDATSLDSQGFNVYFALSTFNENNSRKVDNVKNVKSFFLDLDCGPTKEFSTQEDAISSLMKFCKANTLPRPTIINSGRGVHVYWILEEAVCLADWLPVAERLKALCSKNNFEADPAVTADAARVLRVPQTHNYKPDTPVEVTFIGSSSVTPVDFDNFSALVGGDLIPVPSKRMEGADTMMLAALDNREYKFRDILKKSENGKGCLQIGHALHNPSEVNEPTWRGVLSILKACSDGTREKAHKISRDYDGYDSQETDAKWDNLTPDKRYTCNTFEASNPDLCRACPNRGKFRSPLYIGQSIKEATEDDNVVTIEAPAFSLPNTPTVTYIIPEFPKPYMRGANGGVYIRTRDKDGDIEEREIYRNDIYVVQRVMDVETGEAVVIRLHMPKDGVREFTIPLTAVTSRDEFRKELAKQGVTLLNVEDLMKYVMAWINKLQDTKMADNAHRQFGWTDNQKTFILGNQKIHRDSIEFNPPSAATVGLFPAFEPKGDFESWKKLMDFYNRDGFELHQYVICMGFGSILMEFIGGIACSALHLYSKESGLGKTTAMKAAASIWGNPEDLVLDERDTHNSKMLRSEILHSLPLFIDELTNSSPEDLSNLAYQFTSGKQRARMVSGANAERPRGLPWSLLAVTTGNTSMIERIRLKKENPSAEAQRILEVQVDKLFTSTDTKAETDEFTDQLELHHGHAGIVFVQYVLKNIDAVKYLLKDVQANLDKNVGLKSENRFWSAGAAATITGAIIANKLELIGYSIPKITAWIEGVLADNKGYSAAMAVTLDQTLNEYLAENYNSILRIKSTADARSSTAGADSLVQPELTPRGQLVARYETDTKKLFLVPKPFRKWCGKQQINYAQFTTDLKNKMGARQESVRLAKGTLFKINPMMVWVLDFKEGGTDGKGGSTDV